MIVHGGNDENVHFRHSARFIDALNKARKPYELLMFPSERHMPRGEADRVYMEERIRDFLGEHLGGERP
jgi:dipeptidyl-peptidase-4